MSVAGCTGFRWPSGAIPSDATPPETLRYWFGAAGLLLWRYANGEDNARVGVTLGGQIKSVSNSTTTPRDLVCEKEVSLVVWMLAESVAGRLRGHKLLCNTVQAHFRENTMKGYGCQCRLDEPTQLSQTLAKTVMTLYLHHKPKNPLRSVGVHACNLVGEPDQEQLSLYPEEKKKRELLTLEQTVDAIRGKYGDASVVRGVMLTDPQLSRAASELCAFAH